ncbi:MAG: AMP-binding protein [Bacillota bacterium]
MPDWLAKRRQLTPERLALVDDRTGARLDYRTFDQQANYLAQGLQELGVRAQDRLAVLSRNRTEYFLTLFAAASWAPLWCPSTCA